MDLRSLTPLGPIVAGTRTLLRRRAQRATVENHRRGLRLRVEAFNVLSHTQFIPLVGALGATLGKLTGARDRRILQGAIKVSF